jgi:hypothetical protein
MAPDVRTATATQCHALSDQHAANWDHVHLQEYGVSGRIKKTREIRSSYYL